MPSPGLIAGASSVIGTGLNAIATGISNKKNRKFQEQMYERQFQDNINFWNMQNAYNSPERQMERFKAAGLNPNLIYGQGNAGNAGAITSPTATKMDYKAPDFGGLNTAGTDILSAIYDTEIKKAQADKLKADTTVSLEQGLLTGINADLAGLNLAQQGELYDTNVDFRKQQLQQLNAQTDVLINKDMREALMNANNLKLGMARTLQIMQNMETQRMERKKWEPLIQGMKYDTRVKQLDAYFAQKNIRPQDPFYVRAATVLLDKLVQEYNSDAPIGEQLLPKISKRSFSKSLGLFDMLKGARSKLGPSTLNWLYK